MCFKSRFFVYVWGALVANLRITSGSAAGAGPEADAIARLQALEGLLQGAIARLATGDGAGDAGDMAEGLGAIAAEIAALVAALNPATLQPPEGMGEGRWRAIAVELHRQLRLLGLDGQFLRTAKQPDTLRRRLQQMLERLEPLRHYLQWRAPDGGPTPAGGGD